MTSNYRITTSIGECDFPETACYADFQNLVKDCSTVKDLMGMRRARFLHNMGAKKLPENKLWLNKMYIRHGKKKDVSPEIWWNLYQVLSNFSATAPYIIKMSLKDIQKGEKEIGINLRTCPTHIGHFIMNLVRIYDEKWGKFVKTGTELFPQLGVNNSMLFLILCQMVDNTNRENVEYYSSNSVRLLYHTGYEAVGHSICPFMDGIPKEAIRLILKEGSLDYFFSEADRRGWEWARHTFNHKKFGGTRKISRFFSPMNIPNKDRLILNPVLPTPWNKEEFLNYFNQIEV